MLFSFQLERAEYYTVPELSSPEADADGRVVAAEGVTIGRKGYGAVFWPGPVDLTGLDLDSLIQFRHKEVGREEETGGRVPLRTFWVFVS